MAEMTKNDQAYIIVTKELIQRQNDLDALSRLEQVASNINQYSRAQMGEISPSREHSEMYRGLSLIVTLLSDVQKLRAEKLQIATRIDALKSMAETYMRGGDIVLEKLSKD